MPLPKIHSDVVKGCIYYQWRSGITGIKNFPPLQKLEISIPMDGLYFGCDSLSKPFG